jgi:hypothetical protein
MSRWEKARDSWYHYRHQMRLGRVHALGRTVYYEALKREPWAKNRRS